VLVIPRLTLSTSRASTTIEGKRIGGIMAVMGVLLPIVLFVGLLKASLEIVPMIVIAAATAIEMVREIAREKESEKGLGTRILAETRTLKIAETKTETGLMTENATHSKNEGAVAGVEAVELVLVAVIEGGTGKEAEAEAEAETAGMWVATRTENAILIEIGKAIGIKIEIGTAVIATTVVKTTEINYHMRPSFMLMYFTYNWNCRAIFICITKRFLRDDNEIFLVYAFKKR
jgi:hypothetical protein